MEDLLVPGVGAAIVQAFWAEVSAKDVGLFLVTRNTADFEELWCSPLEALQLNPFSCIPSAALARH
jgi:hypothetical protein